MFFTATAAQITTTQITAPEAEITVRTQDGLTEARVEITGPQERIEGATANLAYGVWTICLPEVAPQTSTFTSSRGGRVTNFVANVSGGGRIIQAANINGANIQVGGDMIFGNSGTVHTDSGTVYNNTWIQSQEPVTVTLVIPTGIDLTARVGSGRIDTLDADIRTLDAHTGSGSVLTGQVAEAFIHTGSGNVDVRELVDEGAITTGSGDIQVEGGASLTLRTGSGNIRFSATRDATVTARTGSGNIRVRRGDHRVDSRLRTGTGSIREA